MCTEQQKRNIFHMTSINNFTFVVLTYNHSNYILEHLESIKYLIENFGNGISVGIIIADDGSLDNTVPLAQYWLKKNSYLFNIIRVISDGVNRGTCKNLTRALENLETDYCKITAGDDVYSCENLFIEVEKINNNHILSGLPLNLVNGTIMPNRFDLFNLFASNIIYKKSQFITRLKRINFFNTPNIIYSTYALTNKEITTFVDRFSVTEDYPLKIKMAQIYRPLKYVQIENTLVYYRRTANSTYIVKKSLFSKDKLDIINYLIISERNIIDKLLLRNRLFCYKLENKYLKRILNMSVYLYGFNILRNILSILSEVNKFDAQINKLHKYQAHYEFIVARAKNYQISTE